MNLIICDKCQAAAADQLIFKSDDERIDLCLSCKALVLKALGLNTVDSQHDEDKPKGRGRPKHG